MTAFFSTRSPDADAAERQARADRAATIDSKTLREHDKTLREHDAATKQAYERGRRDERARVRNERRHGAPIMTFILLIGAAAGATAIYLGVSQGSFARGGQVADQSIAGATAPAAKAMQSAASSTGDALQNAGARLKGSSAPAPAQPGQS